MLGPQPAGAPAAVHRVVGVSRQPATARPPPLPRPPPSSPATTACSHAHIDAHIHARNAPHGPGRSHSRLDPCSGAPLSVTCNTTTNETSVSLYQEELQQTSAQLDAWAAQVADAAPGLFSTPTASPPAPNLPPLVDASPDLQPNALTDALWRLLPIPATISSRNPTDQFAALHQVPGGLDKVLYLHL